MIPDEQYRRLTVKSRWSESISTWSEIQTPAAMSSYERISADSNCISGLVGPKSEPWVIRSEERREFMR
jgi:hypothetical protein